MSDHQQLVQDVTGPECQLESVRKDETADGYVWFGLGDDPGNRSNGNLTESIIVSRSASTPQAALTYARTPVFVSCVQGQVTSTITQSIYPGVAPHVSQAPITFALPLNVVGARYTDFVSCGCPPLKFDAFTIQVGRARAVLSMYGTLLPDATELDIIKNASVRLAAAEGMANAGTETPYAHPQVVNDPLRTDQALIPGLADLAGGTAPPVPWTSLPRRGDNSLTLVPGGAALHMFDAGQQWVSAPLRGDIQERTDATVQVTAGSGAIEGVGCVANGTSSNGFEFAIADPGTCMILQFDDDGHFERILMRGTTTAMRPTTMPNRLSIECQGQPGPTSLVFAVNGTVVAETTLPYELTTWWPAIYIYGTHGPATATFTNMVESIL
jgi:hypothetical protein